MMGTETKKDGGSMKAIDEMSSLFCEKSLREEVAMLRKKVQELEDDQSKCSSKAGEDSGSEQLTESAIVASLRKELAKVENERADMEMQFMNQMAQLAFENQSTIEGLQNRLRQQENKKDSADNDANEKLKESQAEFDKIKKKWEEERLCKDKEIDNLKKEKASADHELAENKMNLDQMHEEIVDLDDTRNSLVEKVEHLKSQITEKDGVILAMKEKLDVVQQDSEEKMLALKNQLQKGAAAKNEELGEMNDELLRLQEDKTKLQNELDLVTKQNHEKDGQIHDLKNNINGMEQDYQHHKNQLSKTRKDHEQKIALKEKEYNEKISAIEKDFQEQIVAKEKDFQQLKSASDSEHQQKMSQLELNHRSEMDEIRKQLQTVENSKTDQLTEQLREVNEALALSKEENAKRLQQVEHWKLQNDEKDAVVLSLTNKLDEMDRHHEQRMQQVQQEIQQSATTRTKEYGEMNDALMQLETAKTTLIDEVATLRKQLGQEQAISTHLQSSIDDLTYKKNQMEKYQNNEVSTLKEDLDKAQLELCSVTKSYHSKIDLLDQEVTSYRMELEDKGREFDRLTMMLSDEQTKNHTLDKRIAELNRQITENKQDYNRIIQLEGQIDNLENEVRSLTEQLIVAEQQAEESIKIAEDASTNATKDVIAELEWLRKEKRSLDEEIKELEFKLEKEKETMRRLVQKHREEMDQASSASSDHNTNTKPIPAIAKRGIKQGGPPALPAFNASHAHGQQTPPVTPPRTSSATPRTPVRGIVESFERRISKSTNCVSSPAPVIAVAAAEVEGLKREMDSEIYVLKRELEHEKDSVVILESKLQVESDLVQQLREELANMDRLAQLSFDELQDKLDSSEKELFSLRTKVDEYEIMLTDAENDVFKNDQEIKSKLSENENLRSELEATVEKLREAEDELSRTVEKLRAAEDELSRISVDMNKANEFRVQFETKSKDDELEIERLKQEIAAFSEKESMEQSTYLTEIERLTEKVATASSVQHDLEQTCKMDKAEIERLQAQISSIEKQNRGEIGRLQAQITNIEKQKEEILAKNAAEIEQFKSRITEAEASIKQYKEKTSEDQAIIEQLQSEHSSSSGSSTDYSETSSEDHLEEVTRLRSQVEALQKELSDTLIRADAQKHKMEKLETQLKSAPQDDHLEEATRLRSQVEALQNELKDGVARAKERKEQAEQLEKERDAALQDVQEALQHSHRSYDAELKQLKLELTKTQMSKADLEKDYKKKIEELETELDCTQNSVDQDKQIKQEEFDNLQLQLSRKIDEVALLEREREQICSSMNTVSSSRKDELEELQIELMDMTKKTASQTREIQSLKMRIEESGFRSEELGQLRVRCKELEQQIRRNDVQKKRYLAEDGDFERLREENCILRESIRNLSLERRTLQDKLNSIVHDRTTSSKSAQVLRDRNAALRKEVEKLTKRLKKMESSMTRFAI